MLDFASRRFDGAAEGFREVRSRCDGEDGPSDLYLRTIARFADEPPDEDWDGVINFATK